MKIRKRRILRAGAAFAVLAAVTAIVAPRLDTGRFAGRVRESLEAALGRRVEVQGKVRLDVFGPGFSAEKVVIHDDPSVSLEPIAYVESLEARVSFASFWTGRLEFSSLRLENPSLNLARYSDRTELNVSRVVRRTAGAPSGAPLPDIQVRGGRVNFKVDETKSIVYLTEVSMDLNPPSAPGGAWRFRIEGSPARTDRAAQRYGIFRARGSWRPDAPGGGALSGSMELERSSLGEWIRLVHGHDIGIHGQITSRARFTGPLSNIAVAGRVEISDIHRWDLLPPYWGYWPFDFRGTLDLSSQTFEAQANCGPPVQVTVRASGILGRLIWGARVAFMHVPLADATALARQMGLAVPPGLAAAGLLDGVVGYSPGTGAAGIAVARKLKLESPGEPALEFPRAELVLDGPSVRLLPAEVRIGSGAPLRLEAEYSWPPQAFDAVITAASAPIPETVDATRLAGAAPVLELCSKGAWRGMLRYQKRPGSPGIWTGVLDLEDAVLDIDGFAAPVTLASARVALRESGTAIDRISGRIGAAVFTGEYRYRAGASRPHQLRLSVEPVEAAELERIFAPALHRDEGFLTRALRLGRSRPPEWLGARHAEAAFEIASVSLAGVPLNRVRGKLRWDGTEVRIPNLSAAVEDGSLTGDFSASLSGSVPSYRFDGRYRNLAWSGGEWDGTGVLTASGTGAQLLQTLRIETGFSGRSVAMTPDARFKTVSGQCTLSFPRGAPVVRLSKLQATLGDDTYQGRGATAADGRLNLDLAGTDRELRLTGTLSPFKLEPRP